MSFRRVFRAPVLAVLNRVEPDAVSSLRRQVSDLSGLLAMRTWLPFAAESQLKITVITATNGKRSEMLAQAVSSVSAQTHRNWEHVVVDDSESGLGPLGVTDARLHILRNDHHGLSNARNAALEHASGDVVTYLDDDNVMGANWLQGIAWAFDRFPQTTWLYGARVVESDEALYGTSGLPIIDFPEIDETSIRKWNRIDINAVAHVADRSVRFDPRASTHSDWDLVLTLLGGARALKLPLVACAYRTLHEGRMLAGPAAFDDLEYVRRKHALANNKR